MKVKEKGDISGFGFSVQVKRLVYQVWEWGMKWYRYYTIKYLV